MAIAHVRNSFELIVNAPYETAARLFAPVAERQWAGEDWKPEFLFPRPERDCEGAVFTLRRGGRESVWINTRFDLEARRFQYVYFIPSVLVTRIDISFESLQPQATRVSVVYTRTALQESANGEVEALGASDRQNGEHWQEAIHRYLLSAR